MVLVNRLKVVLNFIISPTQSSFQQGKLITNNDLIAFKTWHYLKRKTQEKRGEAGLKLDMSKAYDRFEWEKI